MVPDEVMVAFSDWATKVQADQVAFAARNAAKAALDAEAPMLQALANVNQTSPLIGYVREQLKQLTDKWTSAFQAAFQTGLDAQAALDTLMPLLIKNTRQQSAGDFGPG